MTAPQGAWICIDGVEGVGKTTLTAELASALDVDTASEFSDAPFGAALRDAVRVNPHLISASGTAQSLVFLGDFFELYATKIAPRLRAGRSVITDRGYVSKWAYQSVILSDELGADRATRLLDEILGLLPAPDLTLYLSCPIDVLAARLLARDGHCNSARQAFITRADEAGTARLGEPTPPLNHVILDATLPAGELTAAAASAIERGLPAERIRRR